MSTTSVWHTKQLMWRKEIQYHSKVSWQSRLETWFLILEVFENRESSFDAWVLSFDLRGSSFEFRDTRRIFRGSRTEILRKRFNSWKQNHSDEQHNWCAALFGQTCFECMQIFFRVVYFLQGTCDSLHVYTLKLITQCQQTNVPAICIYSFTCQTEWVFFLCATTTQSECVVFICVTSTGCQNVNKR